MVSVSFLCSSGNNAQGELRSKTPEMKELLGGVEEKSISQIQWYFTSLAPPNIWLLAFCNLPGWHREVIQKQYNEFQNKSF